MKARSLLVILLVITFTFTFAEAAIINIPAEQSTIQAGLIAANEGDTVLVAPGTYFENITWPSVNGISLFSSGDSSNTIIDGNESGKVLSFTSNVIDTTTIVKGFRLRNGTGCGAGIYCNDSNPKLIELQIVDNNCNSGFYSDGGGGVYFYGAYPVLENSTIENNNSLGKGGSAYISRCFEEGQYVIFRNCIFKNNTSNDYGGAAYLSSSNIILYNCSISENKSADSYYDGIYINSGDVQFLSGYIGYNYSQTGADNGYGIYAISADLTIRNVLIEHHRSSGIYCKTNSTLSIDSTTVQYSSHQGIYALSSDVTVTNSLIQNNNGGTREDADGGGIFCNSGNLVVENSQILNNDTGARYSDPGLGGGISLFWVDGIIRNSTISGNYADNCGGGIYCRSSTLSIENSVISNNSADEEYVSSNSYVYENGSGGGASFCESTVTMDGVEFFENTCENRGGGILTYKSGNIAIRNSKIYSNYADYSFGALFVNGAIDPEVDTLTYFDMHKSYVFNNSSTYSSAIYFNNKKVTISSSTFDKNFSGTNSYYQIRMANQGGYAISSIDSCNFNSLNRLAVGYYEENFSALNNWWNHPEGPSYYSLDDSKGDVCTNANYTPFLTSQNPDIFPVAPYGVEVVDDTDNSVTLKWRNAYLPDLSNYRVYYDTEPGFSYANFVDLGTDTSGTVENLNFNTVYYFAVTCRDSDGDESWYSNEVSRLTRRPRIRNVPADYLTIQSALDVSVSEDTILVQPGTYYENIIWPDVNSISLISSSGPQTTHINGFSVSRVLTFTSSNLDSTTHIKGFTISNGYSDDNGAGIYCVNASPKFESLIIQNNHTNETTNGGGLYCQDSDLILDDIEFYANSAKDGGAIWNCSNGSVFRNLYIHDNTASGFGGGICFYQRKRSIYDSVIRNNQARDGGGIYAYNGLELFNSSVCQNNASNNGGGIWVKYRALIRDTKIDSNQAKQEGGGIRASNTSLGTMNIYDSKIRSNSVVNPDSSASGAGIFSIAAGVNVENCIISYNRVVGHPDSSEGGGMSFYDSGVGSIKSSEITNNYSSGNGGGIAMMNNNKDFENVFIANNNADIYGGGYYAQEAESEIVNSTFAENHSGVSGGSICIRRGTHNFIRTDIISADLNPSNSSIFLIDSDESPQSIFTNCNIISDLTDEPGVGGIEVGINHSLTLTNNNFQDCSQAILNNSGGSFSSTFNYWGDSTGPYHSIMNTTGLGDTVSSNVIVVPFLSTPVVEARPLPPTGLSIQDINGTTARIRWNASPVQDLESYRVYYDNDEAGFPYSNSVSVHKDSLAVTLENLNVSGDYHFATTAIDTAGNESWYSQDVEVTTIMPVTIHIPDDYSTIQAGLIAANDGDTVLVAPGTYNENIIWPSTNGIKLFAEGDTSNTIIDGNNEGRVLLFNSSEIDTNTVINGFTIQNGYEENGAGIKCINNAGPRLERLNIRNNSTYIEYNVNHIGGGLLLDNVNAIITKCCIENNYATSGGGGIYIRNSTLNLTESRIKENSSSNGGGITFFNGSLFINNVDVISNNATNRGGGIDFYEGTSISNNLRIINNTSQEGGGIGCAFVDLTMTNTTFYDNSSTKGGAIFCSYFNESEFNYISFINNRASLSGDGIFINSGTPTILNSNFMNSGSAIINEGEEQNNSINNWWGDASGPYQETDNPGGLGDTISTNVTFTPFLTAPHPDAPPIPVQHPIVNSVSNTSIELSWDASLIPDLAGYKVYYDTEDDGFPYSNSTDVGEVTDYVLSGLSTSANYHISVVCYDDDGNESWYSDEITATTRNIDVRNLDIGGDEDLAHLVTHNPTIKYSYYDSMGEVQAAYDIDVATNPEFTPVNMWNTGWVNTSDTTAVYGGIPLQDGQTYYLRVRVRTADGFEGNWSTLQFRMNSKPGQPTLVSPFDESVISVMRGITANSVSDAENDEVLYSFLVYDDETCQNLLRNIDGLTDTTWSVTPELPDDQMYWWKAFAYDGFESSDTSATWSFLLNMQDDPPQAFSLLEPTNNSVLTVDTTQLVWHQAFEKDYGDSVIYHVFISETADFSSLTDELVTTDTTMTRRDLGDNKTYYWKVKAQDLNTSGTWSDETWSFHTNDSEHPGAFALLAPSNGAVVPDDTVTVNWTTTADVDPGDEIVYEIQWSNNPEFTNRETVTTTDTFYVLTDLTAPAVEMIQKQGGQSSKTLKNKNKSGSSLDELPDDTTIFWRVRAIDNNDNFVWAFPGENGFSFHVELDEMPLPFSLLTPENEWVSESGDVTLTWESTTDADPQDATLTYYLLVARDETFSDGLMTLEVEDTTYTITDLRDDTQYWWKVRAQDSNSMGTWSDQTWSFDVEIPEAPSAFVLVSPENNTVLPMDTVQVNWTASSDPDPDSELAYIVQWSTDASFQTYYEESTSDTFYVITDLDIPSGDMVSAPGRRDGISIKAQSAVSKSNTATSTASFSMSGRTTSGPANSGPMTDAIEDDQTVYWRVYAEDNDGLTTWAQPGSNGWHFSVYLVQPPLAFSLDGPTDDATCVTGDTTLTWNATADPDPDDAITYVVYLSTDEDFVEVDSTQLTGTSLGIDNLLDDTTYFWKVRAQDSNSPGTWSNEVWSFDVAIPEAPEPFVQISPVNESQITEGTALANWSRSSDNDPGDELTFEIEWADNPDFADAEAATTADTFYTLDELADDETTYWRVKVIDSYGLSTWAMSGESGWSFEVNIPQPPLPFSLVAPDSGLVLDTLAATFEWDATTDPDPGDEVSYVLSLSLAEDFRDTMTVHYVPETETETSFPVPYMLDDTDYWWRVTASDQNGDFTLSDETWTFHTAYPEPPHPFELNGGNIDMNTTGDSIIVTLEWQRTWDPDPESLEYYKVLLDTTDDMDIPIVLADSVEAFGSDTLFAWSKTFAPNELPMLGEGYWTVYAYDDNTEGTWADEPMTIFMTHVDETPWGTIPLEYEFAAAYPNPFNPTLTAVISLPQPSDLTVQVFNVMGQRVATIAEGHYQEGFHSFVFNGQNMASGVYFIIANSPGKLNQVKKVVLMK